MGKGESKSREPKDFMVTLERGVRAVLRDKGAKPAEKIAAVVAGTKIAMIRHRIEEDNDTGFFS